VSSGQKADYSDARQVTSGDPAPVVSWTSDGNLVAEQEASIRVINPSGGLEAEVTHEKESGSMQPYGCGDGHIVFARGTLNSLSVNIWRSEGDGSGVRRLTEGRRDLYPRCSPDGKTVFYVDSTTDAYMKVPIDGGKPERFTKGICGDKLGYDIARDGKTIVLGTYDFKAQRPNISLVSLDSGEALANVGI